MLITVFICIGFMLAVLYIDLMFDVTAVPYRREKTTLPKEVLDPITLYYGRITQNPYVLMFVMLTTTICLVAEIMYALVPRWVGYASLILMALAMLGGSLKVIPSAQRLGSRRDPADTQTSLVHGMLPAHIFLLVCILLLAIIQFTAAGTPRP
jgi:hypothetical protein